MPFEEISRRRIKMVVEEISVPITKIMKGTTLQVSLFVSGIKTYSARLYLGQKLIKLAARIIGCGIEIKLKG